MSTRTASWLAWSLWATVAVGLIFAVFMLLLEHTSLEWTKLPLIAAFTAFVLAFSTVGALVASRRFHNPIGWIMCFCALAYTIGNSTNQYAHYALQVSPGALPAGTIMAWIASWVWSVGAGWAGTFLLLLFPTGRLPTPRWGIVAWLAGGGIVLLAVGIAFTPGPFEAYPSYTNPLGISAAEGILAVLQSIGGIALLVSGFSAIASLIVRFLRSSSEEREQLKWLLYAAALVGLCLVSAIVIETVVGSSEEVNDLTNLLITTSLAAIPVAMGIAILRYRLYDIEVIINRTLVYGTLTAMLVLVYACGVISLQYLLRLLTGQESNLAIVVSTLAIAALFNPLRRRIQSFVDRRFYRRKYDAAKTLEALSARLRDETDLKRISDDLVGVVHETMQPAHVSVWLRLQVPSSKEQGQQDQQTTTYEA